MRGVSVVESSERAVPNAIVLMGVTGSGKTTIGVQLAKDMGEIFADADDIHTAANKAKMAAGIPLTDEDRAPWLAALNELMRSWVAKGEHGVLACSALKANYRETLAKGIEPGAIVFVWLDLSREMLEKRLAARQHSFMNPALLGSQLSTLEEPDDAIRVMNDRAPEVVAAEVRQRVMATAGEPTKPIAKNLVL